jgi:hypothetical protein
VILGLLGYALKMLGSRFSRSDFSSLWSFGIGTINPYTLIRNWKIPTDGDLAVAGTVLLTNLPQLILSFIYLILNSLLTSMVAAAEWASFAHGAHQPLRVSFPRGAQKSAFFLELPYQYSIPMLVLSILMHWLISQGFFIAQIFERYLWDFDDNDRLDQEVLDKMQVTTTGAYSPIAMVLTCVILVILFGSVAILGTRRLRDGMPLAGSCSLAISAACHTPGETSSLLPVKWGVVRSPEGPVDIRHCAFSNDEVELPETGKRYA